MQWLLVVVPLLIIDLEMVQSVTKMAGFPDAPRAFVPMPVMGKTPEQLRDYVNGKDPITGKPVMQEVIAGLTTALNA